MTTTLAVEDLALTLPELLDTLSPGDEVVFTRNHNAVAKLTSQLAVAVPPRPGPGLCKGMIGHIPDDFDAPLEDLREYMEIVGEPASKPARPAPGLGRGSILHMSPDFDDSMEGSGDIRS